MAENEPISLPKRLQVILLYVAAATATFGAVKAFIDLIPAPAPIIQSCSNPRLNYDALDALFQDAKTIFQTTPKSDYKLESNFDFYPNGKPVDLATLIIAASPELKELESDLIKQKNSPEKSALYFLHAPGGSGKTPLMKSFQEKSVAAYINLTQLDEELRTNNSTWATKETELHLFGKDLSWQPKIKPNAFEGGLEAFLKRISPNKNYDFSKGVIIDSLDEIHPDSALKLLETIAEWSKIYPDRIVIVAGRGEAFREYVIRNELRSVYNEIRIPNLYLGDESLMSWYVNDYVRFRYKSESDTSKVKRSSELLHGLKELIKKHSFTRNFLYPGSLGNFALDNVRYSNQDEQRLEALMFQTLIERNRKTHNRPGKGDTELWSIYKDALIQIARRYKPDSDTGVFLVGSEDTVCVANGQSYTEVNVGNVLLRSGLIDLNPVNERYLEFMFWPKNLHRFLAEGELE